MRKVAVVYWSSTGNTEAMANAIAEGARSAGAASAEELLYGTMQIPYEEFYKAGLQGHCFYM